MNEQVLLFSLLRRTGYASANALRWVAVPGVAKRIAFLTCKGAFDFVRHFPGNNLVPFVEKSRRLSRINGL